MLAVVCKVRLVLLYTPAMLGRPSPFVVGLIVPIPECEVIRSPVNSTYSDEATELLLYCRSDAEARERTVISQKHIQKRAAVEVKGDESD